MPTKLVGAVAVFLLCVGVVAAEEVKGKIKSFDSSKGRIVLECAPDELRLLIGAATPEEVIGRLLARGVGTVAIKAGSAENAVEATKQAVRDLDMAVSRGVLHKRNAARRKSRLNKRLRERAAAKK